MNSILCITTYPDTNLYKFKRLLISLLFKSESLNDFEHISDDTFQNMYKHCLNKYKPILTRNIKIVFAIDGISGKKYNNYKTYETDKSKEFTQDVSLLLSIIDELKNKYDNVDICGTYNHTNVSVNRSIICQLYKDNFIMFMDDDDISCNLDTRNFLINASIKSVMKIYTNKLNEIKKDFGIEKDIDFNEFLKLKTKFYKQYGNSKRDIYDKYFEFEICLFTSQIHDKPKNFIHSLTTIGFFPHCLDTVFSVTINQQEDVCYYKELKIYERVNLFKNNIFDVNYISEVSHRDYTQQNIGENLITKRLMSENYYSVHNSNGKLNKHYGKMYYNQYSIIKFVQNGHTFNRFAGNCIKPKIYKYLLNLPDNEIEKYNDVC